MADKDGLKVAKNYRVELPFANQGDFHVKGANGLDWGMKKRLSNIFDPKTGKTVMFAFDHGYFMGSTAGLERLDLTIPQLMPYVDVLMCTRGALRTCVPAGNTCGVALRVSSGSSMLDDDLSHEVVAVDIEDAIKLDADCMAVQTFIGADGQLESIDNLSQVINAGMTYGSRCYLTTACIRSKNLPDNCTELMTLRSYRDTYLQSFEEGRCDIQHYYEIAPSIVLAIDAHPNADQIYVGIYDNLIVPCVKLIADGNFKQAHQLYKNTALALKEEFLPTI